MNPCLKNSSVLAANAFLSGLSRFDWIRVLQSEQISSARVRTANLSIPRREKFQAAFTGGLRFQDCLPLLDSLIEDALSSRVPLCVCECCATCSSGVQPASLV